MILEAILTSVFGFIGALLDGLSSALPDGAAPTIGTLVYGYSLLNTVLPVSEVFDVAVLSLQVIGGLSVMYVLIFALRFIPFLNMGR